MEHGSFYSPTVHPVRKETSLQQRKWKQNSFLAKIWFVLCSYLIAQNLRTGPCPIYKEFWEMQSLRGEHTSTSHLGDSTIRKEGGKNGCHRPLAFSTGH